MVMVEEIVEMDIFNHDLSSAFFWLLEKFQITGAIPNLPGR
jgi:hypothetical protein